jgi:hypothetical protein
MDSSLLELLPEALELALVTVGSLVLSLAGAYIERFAFVTLESGELGHAAWAAFMGAMVLYFAYLLVTDQFVPRFLSIRQTLADG